MQIVKRMGTTNHKINVILNRERKIEVRRFMQMEKIDGKDRSLKESKFKQKKIGMSRFADFKKRIKTTNY